MGITNLLLDTCALLWWWSEPDTLSPRILSMIKEPSRVVWISAASAWEISTKHRIGKFPQGNRIIVEWEHRIVRDRFRELQISAMHALRAGSLPGEHRDPFDRMIAAQGLIEGFPIASPDTAISSFSAERIW